MITIPVGLYMLNVFIHFVSGVVFILAVSAYIYKNRR